MRRRKHTLKENLISFAIGCALAIPFCIGHVCSVNHWKEIRQEAAYERIAEDRQREAEILRAKQEDATYEVAQDIKGGGEN